MRIKKSLSNLIAFILLNVILSFPYQTTANSPCLIACTTYQDSVLNAIKVVLPSGYYVLNENGFLKVTEERLNLNRCKINLSLAENELFEIKGKLGTCSYDKVGLINTNGSLVAEVERKDKSIFWLRVQKYGLSGLSFYLLLRVLF
jgi:hypothetical protein